MLSLAANSSLLGRVPNEVLPCIVNSCGHELVNQAGARYRDAISGAYAAVLGYSLDSVIQAMSATAAKVPYVHNARFDTEESVSLASMLSKLSGRDYCVYFSVSGADGVEAALRIAVAYGAMRGRNARQELACLSYSYHGSTGFALSATGHAAARGIYTAQLKEVRRLDLMRWVRSSQCFQPEWVTDPQEIAHLIGDETAVVMLEPMLGNAAGCVEVPNATLLAIESVCRAKDIVVIADEVSVGVWRTDGISLSHAKSVAPDIIVLGKALTAGLFPLSAVLVAPHIAAELNSSVNLLGHTHGAHPVGCAVALDVIRQILEPEFQAHMALLRTYFAERLDALTKLPGVISVRGRGLMYSVCLDPLARENSRSALSGRLYSECLSRGVLVMPGSSIDEHGELVSDHVTLAPAFNMPISTLHEIFDQLGKAVLSL